MKLGVKIPKYLTNLVSKLVKKWSKWVPKMSIFTPVPKYELNKTKLIKLIVKLPKFLIDLVLELVKKNVTNDPKNDQFPISIEI